MAKQRYRVIFSRAADRQLQKLPPDVQKRIVRGAETLEANPRRSGAVKLAGRDDLYRFRVGDYRIVYQIDDEGLIVLVVRVAHRGDVYRKGN